MRTPATAALDAAGAAYEVTTYDARADGGYGTEAATACGFDPDAVGKTLVVQLDDGRLVAAVVPVSGSLDLKALARAAGAKRADMAGRADAERVTGYVRGGISPFGQRQQLPVFLDELLAASERIHVSGGRRGVELTMAPEVLVEVVGATVADLSR